MRRQKQPPLSTFRAKQFKALRDTGKIKFGAFTVIVGNNGCGKSSLIEAIECFSTIITNGADAAMSRWKGPEHVFNKAAIRRSLDDQGITHLTHPLEFSAQGTMGDTPYKASLCLTTDPALDELMIKHERLELSGELQVERSLDGRVRDNVVMPGIRSAEVHDKGIRVRSAFSAIREPFSIFLRLWQFFALNPTMMSDAVRRTRTGLAVRLARDGSNVAETDALLPLIESYLDTTDAAKLPGWR